MEGKKLEKVRVKDKEEILQALRPFMPDSKSTLRKALMDGFDVVRRRVVFNTKTESNLDVNSMHFWVDTMIDERLGGKREGMTITWDVSGKKYVFDPTSGELKGS